MSKIDFSKIKKMIDSSLDFTLTEKQYKKLVNRDMPKNTDYLVKKSAVSKFAKDNGLCIKINERTISFEKITD